MAAKSDSDSSSSTSSSSSSSSDGEESAVERVASRSQEVDVPTTTSSDHKEEDTSRTDHDVDIANTVQDDTCKVFLSRIPQTFNEESITRILQDRFGEGCVIEVSIVYERSEEDNDDTKKDIMKEGKSEKDEAATEHRGFGFVTFATTAQRQAAIDAGTVRGSAKSKSKRKHTMYIRPVVRDDEEVGNAICSSTTSGSNKNICFLWQQHRCPYGEDCKFVHEGDGGSIQKDDTIKKKKEKCFQFKKCGKCKLADKCPYSHDIAIKTTAQSNKSDNDNDDTGGDKNNNKNKKDKSQVDCINWKNKGKCRKGIKCPYRHDESIRDKVLAKKNKNKDSNNNSSDDKQQKKDTKNRHPLSIRVFGLNYDTTSDDIRTFFKHCGPIMEITFPTFEDSGRSKGYCGVLFQSPKAVEKAVAMNGSELHGRWLSIQEGKMYLRKWEEVENGRKRNKDDDDDDAKMKEEREKPLIGEYGQKVKKRKKHGFKD